MNHSCPSRRTLHLRSAPWRDPEELFGAATGKPGLLWLDSQQGEGWSFLAHTPAATLTGSAGCFVYRRGEEEMAGEEPFDLLESALAGWSVATGPIPFSGGAAGYLGYELLRFAEPTVLLREREEKGEEPIWLGFYDQLLAFDHERRKLHRVVNLPTGEDPEGAFATLTAWLALSDKKPTGGRHSIGPLRSNFTESAYRAAVERVRDYIAAGDCYQVNIAQRFGAEGVVDAPAFYRTLRRSGAVPYGAYIDCGEYQILSTSPERFVKVVDGAVDVRPIKGTRPRGESDDADRRLHKELVTSAKERAENIMIVDLLRNDLSRVCRPGSVVVPELCVVESFPTVNHLVSTIRGILRSNVGPAELLRALFPCGSVTGAPKIRAMQIIDEIEPAPRNAYCGGIGYFGYDGSIDLSVSIRMVTIRPERLLFHVGGGVTWPSDALEEYGETLLKAEGIVRALREFTV